MNQITLLEFCQDPNNRIKLMEYLIYTFIDWQPITEVEFEQD